MTYIIPRPPREIFRFKPKEVDIVHKENPPAYMTDHFEIGEGIRQYIKGGLYPDKGWVYPEAVDAINQAKRYLMVFTHGVPFSFRGAVSAYCKLTDDILKPHYIEQVYMTPFASEVLKFIDYMFRWQLNYDERLPWIVSTIFEYDNSYRFRGLDIMSECDEDDLYNKPIREIFRLAKIAGEREFNKDMTKRIHKLKWLSLCLLIPKYRKAFRKAIELANFDNFRYDKGDNYWVSFMDGYYYQGMSYEERSKRFTKPQMYQIK